MGETNSVVVASTYGLVRGTVDQNGVAFRGVPYARPPLGDLRFRQPQPPEPWSGVRNCMQFGADCPHPRTATLRSSGVVYRQPTSEDCLYLNVWTPAADDAKRPTMVWIHGGGWFFGSGAAPVYGGAAFARDDVVLVTINYRLHVFGFLYLDELFPGLEPTGNIGLRDPIAALQWVRDNISRFGGDPDNVTIFGQSAGAASVATLLGMPGADGLFKHAIVQSGSAELALPAAAATKFARRTLRAAGIGTRDLRAIRRVPAKYLTTVAVALSATSRNLLGGDGRLALPYMPVVDGCTLPAIALDRIAAGSARHVDLIVGYTADEVRLIFGFGRFVRMFAAVLKPDVGSYFPAGGPTVAQVLSTYASTRAVTTSRDLQWAILTDKFLAVPSLRLAEAQQGSGGRVWLYRFDWRSPARSGTVGAAHGLDLPFVFDVPSPGPLWGPNPSRGLAKAMHGSWVQFARTGDPGGGAVPQWPPYLPDTRTMMLFDHTSNAVDDVDPQVRELWASAL
jgi:para-nitrobenzyl esterase